MNRDVVFGLIFGFLGVAAFSGTLPASRITVATLDPLFVTAARAAGAGVLAIMRPPRPKTRSDWARLAGFAACVIPGFPLLINLGVVDAPASHGGVVLALLPIATAIAAVIVAGERPSPAFWAVACASAALVLTYALREGGGGFSAGDAPLFAAVAVASLGYALGAGLTRTLGAAAVISWALAPCFPAVAVATAFLAPAALPSDPAPLLGLAYMIVFSQWLGFFAWNRGLALGGVARVGQIQHLQTFLTLAISALLLGEALTLIDLIFAAGVVALVAAGGRLKSK